MTALGLVLLVAGSNLFVERRPRRSRAQVGMSERMLGLTVISLGTALPELIGSLVAAARGHSALAIGSVIGSNLLNVFLVLGVTAYLQPIRLGERMHLVDLIGLVVITLLGVLMLRGSRKITRLEGAFLSPPTSAFIVCCRAAVAGRPNPGVLRNLATRRIIAKSELKTAQPVRGPDRFDLQRAAMKRILAVSAPR